MHTDADSSLSDLQAPSIKAKCEEKNEFMDAWTMNISYVL